MVAREDRLDRRVLEGSQVAPSEAVDDVVLNGRVEQLESGDGRIVDGHLHVQVDVVDGLCSTSVPFDFRQLTFRDRQFVVDLRVEVGELVDSI